MVWSDLFYRLYLSLLLNPICFNVSWTSFHTCCWIPVLWWLDVHLYDWLMISGVSLLPPGGWNLWTQSKYWDVEKLNSFYVNWDSGKLNQFFSPLGEISVKSCHQENIYRKYKTADTLIWFYIFIMMEHKTGLNLNTKIIVRFHN